jgi:hypothetical protein
MKRSITIAALLLGTAFGTAQAQQAYSPPATAAAADPATFPQDLQREDQAASRALAERRQRMIDDCEQNHGSEIDCQREVDTELRAEGLQSRTGVIHLRPAR